MRVLRYIFPLASIACLAAAQENQPTTLQGFEGQTVSSVDFSANPLIDVQGFRPLLKQQPNVELGSAVRLPKTCRASPEFPGSPLIHCWATVETSERKWVFSSASPEAFW